MLNRCGRRPSAMVDLRRGGRAVKRMTLRTTSHPSVHKTRRQPPAAVRCIALLPSAALRRRFHEGQRLEAPASALTVHVRYVRYTSINARPPTSTVADAALLLACDLYSLIHRVRVPPLFSSPLARAGPTGHPSPLSLCAVGARPQRHLRCPVDRRRRPTLATLRAAPTLANLGCMSLPGGHASGDSIWPSITASHTARRVDTRPAVLRGAH